ncbi:MAG: hypothetical protein IT299_05710 [Dehalococcoidia bacterium]|nr:hypothetical protein [Dehalococcoidia bacterium]
MHFRRVRSGLGLLFAGGALLLAGACSAGGSSGDTVLAERLLRLGEAAGTKLEVKSGELPPDLKTVLNPSATKDTPAAELTSIPVYPGAKLQGSFRMERPDGTIAYFLLYDAAAKSEDVEPALAKLVNESPWQTVGGQSTDAVAALRFQSTTSGDVSGTVAIQPVNTGAGAAALTSIIYIVEVEPSAPPQAEPYVLPTARPVPDGFPAGFILDGMTPIGVQWAAAPQGKQYQMRLLTKQSSLDVTDRYRDAFKNDGWTLVSDNARGFATQLEFEKDGGVSQASVSVDAFSDDPAYTEVALQLGLAR